MLSCVVAPLIVYFMYGYVFDHMPSDYNVAMLC